jgi:AcrR family transcriptional regulator
MNPTAEKIVQAAKVRLQSHGYAAFSTRSLAEKAGVPLSQIHYHFGGKQGVLLALLEYENRALVSRQRQMYGTDMPLWKRYEQACDFLDDDLESGYVRVLQEMIAAGWSDETVAAKVLELLEAWFEVLVGVAREAEQRFGSLGPLRAEDVAGLIGMAFLGGEAVILLGGGGWNTRAREWLRSLGSLIRQFEDRSPPARRTAQGPPGSRSTSGDS